MGGARVRPQAAFETSDIQREFRQRPPEEEEEEKEEDLLPVLSSRDLSQMSKDRTPRPSVHENLIPSTSVLKWVPIMDGPTLRDSHP